MAAVVGLVARPFPPQGPVLEIPHLVRPAHQRDRHGNHVDRAGFALAADPDFQGEFRVDPDLARALVRLEIGDFEDQRRQRAGVPLRMLARRSFQ